MKKTTSGFTIVELLIVIVVIAILAAISIVAYTGIQQRGRDAKRKDDIAKIVKGFQIWSADTGNDQFSALGAGSGGVSAGWFNIGYSPYPSVAAALTSGNYLSSGVVDPINRTSGEVYAYMIASCEGSDTSRRVILAKLEIPPTESLASQLGVTCGGATYASFVASPYNMNYGKIVNLR